MGWAGLAIGRSFACLGWPWAVHGLIFADHDPTIGWAGHGRTWAGLAMASHRLFWQWAGHCLAVGWADY
jgi:hypothetical protein